MSQENVQSFKRAVEAGNRRDVQAVLDELDPDVEWHPGLPGWPALLGGEAAVGRGHEGEVYNAFAELHLEVSDVRDLDDRLFAVGRIYVRGRQSGVEAESSWAYVTECRNGKALVIRTYLDPKEALEAAGLKE